MLDRLSSNLNVVRRRDLPPLSRQTVYLGNHLQSQATNEERKMGLFGGKKSDSVKLDALIKGSGGQCPHCNAELQTIVDQEARPVLAVFRGMGSIAGSVTMDTARAQVIKQGLTCSCGATISSFAK